MVSFIVFIIGILIVVLGVFLSLIASLIQFILNLIIANILPIGLILFGLFILLVISAIFLPEPKESKEEDDFQYSTAQAYTRENTVSNREESKETTIDVKSTVVKEEAKSDKSYKKKKTDRASTKHSTKEKPSSNTENKYCNANSFQTQTTVLFERNVETENHCEIEREQIHYSDSSEVEPELRRLKLSQSKTTIKSGETIQFKVAGLDRFDNQIKISDRISWSATAGEIDSTGLFSFDSIDDVLVTVTAQVSEIEATAKVNIENIYELLTPPKLKSLKVIPDCICLKPKEEQLFTALGFDWDNNLIDCGEIIWSAKGGTIDESGKLTVFDDAKGVYQVTATSKHTPKHNTAVKTTLLTIGVSTRILSWAIANEEFFYDILAPLLDLTNDDDSLSETDAIVQGWILEIGRRRVAKLIKKASNLSFKEAFSNLNDSIDYIVLPKSTESRSQFSSNKVNSKDLSISSKSQASNNSSNPIKEIASKVTAIVSNDSVHKDAVSKDTDNFRKQQAAYSHTNKIAKPNSFTSTGKQEKKIASDSISLSAESQSYSSSSSSFNTDNVNGNSNLASKNSFKLPDNLPAPEVPLYPTSNYRSLPEPSWFYRSQAFYDGFFEGDFSYNTYLEYMSIKDYYSYYE